MNLSHTEIKQLFTGHQICVEDDDGVMTCLSKVYLMHALSSSFIFPLARNVSVGSKMCMMHLLSKDPSVKESTFRVFDNRVLIKDRMASPDASSVSSSINTWGLKCLTRVIEKCGGHFRGS